MKEGIFLQNLITCFMLNSMMSVKWMTCVSLIMLLGVRSAISFESLLILMRRNRKIVPIYTGICAL